jgi:DNA-binding NarL/FixJ family response regulator
VDAKPENREGIQARLQTVISEAIDEVSRISHNISPHVLEKHGLMTALNNLMAPLTAHGRYEVEFITALEQQPDPKTALTVYRCISELLNNTMKHADASRITLEIKAAGSHLLIRYADNGKGFDTARAKKTGMGLHNIHNRVESSGGDDRDGKHARRRNLSHDHHSNLTMEKIRIAIIDDHDLFREGISLVLSQIEGFEVTFSTPDGNRFVEELARTGVDVALMDIEMPALSGALTTERALAVKPDLKVIALTMFSDAGHYTQMIQAGARGFILKKSNKFELEQAILSVHRGGTCFSQEILQKLAFRYTGRGPADEELTTREVEIMVLICDGLTSQEISERLHISTKTVETHRSNLFLKAGVRNVAGLIAWAVRNQFYTIR